MRNSIDLWTPYGGWIRHRGDTPYGYNVTRQVLDPLLRRMTAETPGVELLPGHTATELLGNGDGAPASSSRIATTRAARCAARLVVAADGRDSHVARMAGVHGPRAPAQPLLLLGLLARRASRPTTARGCGSWSPTAPTRSPTRTGSASSSSAPHRDRLPEFRADLEGAYLQLRRRAARRPRPQPRHARVEAARASSTCRTSAARPRGPGLAFVGDAALASDPLWGVGCGWAFQSAEWLVEETADALVGGGDLDAALDSYRKVHRRRLGPAPLPHLRPRHRAARQPARARHVPQAPRPTTRSTARSRRSARAGARPRRCSRRAPWRAWPAPSR